MRRHRAILCSIITFALILLSCQFALAQDLGPNKKGAPTVKVCGILLNAESDPIRDGIVIIEQGENNTKILRNTAVRKKMLTEYITI
jgi:hypothetical protein